MCVVCVCVRVCENKSRKKSILAKIDKKRKKRERGMREERKKRKEKKLTDNTKR